MVKRVFNFVYKEVRGLHQAAYILALFTIGSQILAIVRDRLFAHTFGAGIELDLYYAAFRIPDLLFVLFASVLSIYVLLPFVNRRVEHDGARSGSAVLTQIFSLFLLTYSALALILAVTAPLYVTKLFPGFADYHTELVGLIVILLLQPFLLGLSSLCGVVTQMNHRFVLYALSPLLYNIGIIVGVVALYPVFGIGGLAMGVVLGAIGHLLIQLPFVLRSRYRFSISFSFDWRLIGQVLSVAVPRALTLSVNQLVLLVLISMASLMVAGSVSVFQFAFNLQSVPLAVVGMSYSVAAFPTLSYLYAKADQKAFNLQLITALRHIIFWSLPIISLVIVLRAQLVRVLLGSGEFDWSATRLTAAMLAIFALSLLAQAILLLLVRAFYAGGRTVVPLLIAAFSAGVSVLVAWWGQRLVLNEPQILDMLAALFRLSDVPGTEVLLLGVAFIAGQLIQLVLLLVASVKVFGVRYGALARLCVQAFTAAAAGGISAYAALNSIVAGVNQETFIGIALQGLSAGVIGVIAVILTYLLLRSKELQEVYKSFHSKIFKTDVIAPQ